MLPLPARLELRVGVPIQTFGVIVAAGVLIGAHLLRRYAEWHGVADDHIRGITAWITVTGFIGAHVFDVLAYQWPAGRAIQRRPAAAADLGGHLVLRRLHRRSDGLRVLCLVEAPPARLMADICIVGLLLAFSIGRIGCTVVSDHIGAAVDTNAWYAALAMDYPAGRSARQEALGSPQNGRAAM